MIVIVEENLTALFDNFSVRDLLPMDTAEATVESPVAIVQFGAPEIAAGETVTVTLHPDANPYNDEMFQVGNTGALDPTFGGTGSMNDNSDSTYAQVQHTTSSSSFAAVSMEGFDLPAGATVTDMHWDYRVSGTTDNPSPNTWAFLVTIANEGAAFDDSYPDLVQYADGVNGSEHTLDGSPHNISHPITDADIAFNAYPGVGNLTQLGQLLAPGSICHFYISTPSGFTSQARFYEFSITLTYEVPGGSYPDFSSPIIVRSPG